MAFPVRRGLAALCFAAAFAFAPVLAAQDLAAKVEGVFNRLEEAKGANLQECARELEQLGRGALPDVQKGLTRADAFVRIAVARVLYAYESRTEALDALQKVIDGKTAGDAARRAAAAMAASLPATDRALTPAQKREAAARLRAMANGATDELARISLLRGVWALTETIEVRRTLRDIFEKGSRREVKDEAALALAEADAFIWVKAHLNELAREPGDQGRLARAYLKVNAISEDAGRRLETPAGGKYDYKMLDEVIDTLKENYHDAAKVEDTAKLVEAAARGLLGSLDWYTQYLDEKTIEIMQKEELEGHYGGIGARVIMKKDKSGNAWLTISEPIFSGPAYRAGLRAFDIILEVEGELTVNQEVNDLVRKLRGKEGTPVKFKVRRNGWTKDREFTIVREVVQLEITMSRMLPGDIAYVKYGSFGDLDVEMEIKGTNIEKQVKDFAAKGMKGLILDLRGNSGGYLKTARRVASLFLENDALILRTKSRGVVKEEYKASGGPSTQVPLVVLVDDGSASASEIVAGALQDHKRAVLIGEKTFGKGSVQDLKRLESSAFKTAAKVTIAKWFLPSDRSVEKDNPKDSGIEPDIKVVKAEWDFWKAAEFERIHAEGKVQEYADARFPKDKELFRQLADVDYNDPSKYPDFDALYEAVQTKLSKNELREHLRDVIRMKVQDDLGRELYLDFQKDVQLQRGIVEVAKAAGVDLKPIREYEVLASATPSK